MKQNKTCMATGKQMLGHAIGGVGQNLIYTLWSSFMMIFYTDVFGLGAGFVGALFLAARVWDAINDPMMGMLADKTRSKYGRFRIWLLRTPPIAAVFLVLCFTVPGLEGTAAKIYAVVTYIFMGMAFTAIDIPYWSLPAAMTNDPNERTKIFSYSGLSTNLANTIAGATIVPLVGLLGKGDLQKGYFWTAVLFGVLGWVLYTICFTMVRENVTVVSEKISFKIALKSLVINKPLLMVMITGFAINIAFVMRISMNTYYTRYTLNDFNLMTFMAILALPAVIIGAILTPILCRYMGKKKTMISLCTGAFIVSLIFCLTGYDSIPLVLFLATLQTFFIEAAFILINSMTADTMEYAEWKTGQRNDGVITSTRTLITKFASAIAGVLASVALIYTKYQPNVQQTVETQNSFHYLVSIVPGVILLIGAIPMLFYTLTEERHAQISKEINDRKEKKEKVVCEQ